DLLTEPYESYKNGKLVLCVAAANKRNIKGLIQDESATGQTVYIEPDEMSPQYHLIAEIRSDIRQEINRLIRQISADIRTSEFEILEALTILTAFDIWNARATLAVELDAYLPQLKREPQIEWRKAYHPVRKRHHENVGKTV